MPVVEAGGSGIIINVTFTVSLTPGKYKTVSKKKKKGKEEKHQGIKTLTILTGQRFGKNKVKDQHVSELSQPACLPHRNATEDNATVCFL